MSISREECLRKTPTLLIEKRDETGSAKRKVFAARENEPSPGRYLALVSSDKNGDEIRLTLELTFRMFGKVSDDREAGNDRRARLSRQ